MSREYFAPSFTSLDLVSEQALPADPSDLVAESSLGTVINSGYGQFAGNLDCDPSFSARYGGYWPADRVQNPNHAPLGFFSEFQFWASLSWSRWLDERNMLAKGFAKHVNAFVGSMQVQFVRRGRNPGNQDADGNGEPDDPLVAACQQVWEEWCESADWGQGTEDREEESRNRILRDGECNLRLDCGDRRRDYLPWVRFVEPEQIRRPAVNVRTEGNWDWGVCTADDDAEDPLAYFLADPNSNGASGEEVPGESIVRMKANVDRTIKRGVSDLFPIEAHLQRAIAIMANMEATSQEQSGISWVEKYATATADQVVNQLKLGQAVYQAGSPAAAQARFAPFAPKPYGSTRVIHSDNNKDWIPGPVSEGVPSYSQVLDGTLKGIGFTWGVPGWFSGQGESSFAAALVTGSPFVRLTGMRQKKQSGFTKKLAQRVIELAEKSGRLPAGTSRQVKPTVTAEPVVIADEQKQASVTDMELRNKLIDPQEAIKKRGRDPKVVIANIKAWEKEFAPAGSATLPQLPAPAAGRDPVPAPPGSAGGDGGESHS
ncbi:MAG: hypothetical protein C0467_30010 [Planctomycetaceae bacterium]|nr:hypothetical protein [Planctomycetaceae bacterium]